MLRFRFRRNGTHFSSSKSVNGRAPSQVRPWSEWLSRSKERNGSCYSITAPGKSGRRRACGEEVSLRSGPARGRCDLVFRRQEFRDRRGELCKSQTGNPGQCAADEREG